MCTWEHNTAYKHSNIVGSLTELPIQFVAFKLPIETLKENICFVSSLMSINIYLKLMIGIERVKLI